MPKLEIPPLPEDVKQEIELTSNARAVLESRYLNRDERGAIIETPEQMFWRVAWAVAAAEQDQLGWAKKFYEIMASLDFVPNSPTLMNAGLGGSLSACFVIPIEDSMEGIMDAVKATAMVQKYGGGTGFAGSRIRRKGATVSSTHKHACGPVEVLRELDATSRLVTQGGKRDGANMFVLRYDHPDIREFIHCKDNVNNDGQITRFNISVGVDEAFFMAVERNDRYELIDPHEGPTGEYVNAVEIFNEIRDSAWATGDPGLVFLDRMNQWQSNPVPSEIEIEATNPCGEQPLEPWGSCNLGSINLANFVKTGVALPPPMHQLSVAQLLDRIDYERLIQTVCVATRFLDDVISVNEYADPRIKTANDYIRRIGLGVMGWADLLFKLRVPYSTERATRIASNLMQTINANSLSMSIRLGAEKGSFGAFEKSIYATGAKRWDSTEIHPVSTLRNSTRTTIAPTGTIAIIAGCSSGIEPEFAVAYNRRAKIGYDEELNETKYVDLPTLNRVLEVDLRRMGLSDDKIQRIAEKIIAGGTLADAFNTVTGLQLPEWVGAVYETAMEIPVEAHVAMQAAFQKHTDNAVSKTINLPNSATKEDVGKLYMLAMQRGCHGITMYRAGSRDIEILSVGENTTATANVDNPRAVETALTTAPAAVNVSMPSWRRGIIHKFTVDGVEGVAVMGYYPDGRPGEVFVSTFRSGTTVQGLFHTAAVLMSKLLQFGASWPYIREKMQGSQFEPNGMTRNPEVPTTTSIPDYIVRAFPDTYEEALAKTKEGPTGGLVEKRGITETAPSGYPCPECGQNLIYESGCLTCPTCGYSKC